MEFRLTYEGPLPCNGAPKEKQQIRRQLHPQMAELWNQLPLRESVEVQGSKGKFTRTLGHFDFLPLVNNYLRLVCSLDILFLRHEEPGSIVRHGGDIDNRLKTLFDALRMPQSIDEIPSGDAPSANESPFHCLLEDDQLITQIGVTTDRLLKPVTGTGKKADVLLVMHVRLRPTKATGENILLLS